MLKVTLVHGCFSLFLNCTIGTKSWKAFNIRNTKTETRKTIGTTNSWNLLFCIMCNDKNLSRWLTRDFTRP